MYFGVDCFGEKFGLKSDYHFMLAAIDVSFVHYLLTECVMVGKTCLWLFLKPKFEPNSFNNRQSWLIKRFLVTQTLQRFKKTSLPLEERAKMG